MSPAPSLNVTASFSAQRSAAINMSSRKVLPKLAGMSICFVWAKEGRLVKNHETQDFTFVTNWHEDN